MTRIQFIHTYKDIISVENLLSAWKEFVHGKKNKKDVLEFQKKLAHNIFNLHQELRDKTYKHGAYEAFNINDPKPRNIHKATVRDRVAHHAIYRVLYPFFDRTFTADSFSCRKEKGTHRAIKRFIVFSHKISLNNTRTTFVLKCDIRKFFASINHQTLLGILNQYIIDKDILWLLNQIISSFHSTREGVGLPLGNLTSQLFVNIYMNEFDQFMKHKLKAKYYIRYADDFVIFSADKEHLTELIPKIAEFLSEKLKLSLHPDKVSIKTLAGGVDFLGWVHFPHHRVLRTTTKNRMMKKLGEEQKEASIVSYRGMLSHGNAYKISCILPKIQTK
jgi:retron-type reverse transcriptase